MIHKEGSELLAELFNRMTKKQKISVPQPMCDRISRFMADNGYRIVFGRWYLQAEPRTSNKPGERSAQPDGSIIVPREFLEEIHGFYRVFNSCHCMEDMFWAAIGADDAEKRLAELLKSNASLDGRRTKENDNGK